MSDNRLPDRGRGAAMAEGSRAMRPIGVGKMSGQVKALVSADRPVVQICAFSDVRSRDEYAEIQVTAGTPRLRQPVSKNSGLWSLVDRRRRDPPEPAAFRGASCRERGDLSSGRLRSLLSVIGATDLSLSRWGPHRDYAPRLGYFHPLARPWIWYFPDWRPLFAEPVGDCS